MKSNISPLQPDTFYHIYNRGVNGENIFKSSDNYSFFLNKYSKYIPLIADTYAYTLLKNHFHILIKTKSEAEIEISFKKMNKEDPSFRISTQFSHLFNGYAQAINKQYSRTGSLFETPFGRKEVTQESYLRQLVFYIHYNAKKHSLCSDFRKYIFSHISHLSDRETKIQREEVLGWFGGSKSFVNFHMDLRNLKDNDFHFE